MNRDNLKKVIDEIALNEERFVMGAYLQQPNGERSCVFSIDERLCGTSGCIAGFAFMLENNSRPLIERQQEIDDNYRKTSGKSPIVTSMISLPVGYVVNVAQDYLGLTSQESDSLFYSIGDSVWNMVAFAEPYRYSNLITNNTFTIQPRLYEFSDDEVEPFIISEWCDYLYAGVELDNIDVDTVLDVLKRIYKGEIVLSPSPHYSDLDFYSGESAIFEYLTEQV
jgi:hypothetical protein